MNCDKAVELLRQGIQSREPAINNAEYYGQDSKWLILRLTCRSSYPLDRIAGKYSRRLKAQFKSQRIGDSGTRLFYFDKKAVDDAMRRGQ